MARKNTPKKNNTGKDTPAEKTPENFPVVGIGASAGGLGVLKEFFSNVPENPGIAFVVVVHLSPEEPSMLPELLQKKTNMPVSSALDGQAIAPNHVYIIPPKTEMKLYHGKIQLTEIKDKTRPLPIDAFFHSLARDAGKQAVGIILSGTATDGTKGIREIKAYEGLILVQSKETAEYSGMPGSAISTGVVDMVIPPHKMPQKIVQYLKNSYPFLPEETHDSAKKDLKQDEWLNKILSIFSNQINYDLSHYKSNTIQRRINRRMVLNQIDTYKEYVDYLRQDPDEIDALFKELLIGVTSFFRDNESFESLKANGLSEALKNLPEHAYFRVWVPACSTGEEIYSLAIILKEYLENISKHINLQLFGTDINKQAIEKARKGLYPASIAADVGEERLKKFFTEEGNYFRITEEIRDSVVFSVQNILKDPPFSRINMLSCRNLMIYFNAQTQEKLLPLFHYALNPNGILMLGSSESIGGFTRFFEPLDKKWKIFSKKEVPEALRNKVDFPSEPSFYEESDGQYSPSGEIKEQSSPKKYQYKKDFSLITQNAILKQFSPSAVLIDSVGNILHIEGRVGKYLEQPGGPPSLNIFDQAREGLHIELSSAFRKAKSNDTTISRKRISVKTNGNTQTIDLHIVPQNIEEEQENQKQYLIVFEDIELSPPTSDEKPELKTEEASDPTRIAELERELQLNRENYQATVQELEASNEKLKSTNEELQSSNEELQSTNEELESSKEELQSLNEELQTVNAELQNKVEELYTARDDMYNLLNSRDIATIFVDNEMCVRRFTPEATSIVNLIQTDIGRPLEHVLTNLTYERMINDLRNVVEKLTPKEVEVQTKEGYWYSMRINPYITTDNRIDGAVLTFVSIDEQKETQDKLKTVIKEKEEAHDLVRKIFDMNSEALLVLDNENTMLIANTTFSKIMGVKQQDIQGQTIESLNKEFLKQINLTEHLQTARENGKNFKTNAFKLNNAKDTTTYIINGRIMLKNKQHVHRILLHFKEVKTNKTTRG